MTLAPRRISRGREGRQTLIYYMLPRGRSTLEVLRNYEASLGAKSFRTVFSCASSDGTQNRSENCITWSEIFRW